MHVPAFSSCNLPYFLRKPVNLVSPSYALLCTAVIKPLPDAEECFAGLLLNYINGSIIPAWAYLPLCIIKTVKRIIRCFNVIDSRPDFMKLLVELVPLCIVERLADTWHQKGMKLAPLALPPHHKGCQCTASGA